MSSDKKLILVLGATGAQGRAVVRALLKDQPDGSPSPYAVRALTRNPAGTRAQELAALGVELFQGAFEEYDKIAAALGGCYGAWVNVDTFYIGERREVYCGMRIFEIAKSTPSMRHWVWSGLDYSLKIGGWNPKYLVNHHNAKGRVADFLQAQESIVSDTDMSWSVVSTSPYMEMLYFPMFGPISVRKDGTMVFASSIGDGRVPMVALDDIGYFARYTFDHRAETSAQDLRITSDLVGWDYLVETYTKVTGHPAVYVRQTMDEWWNNFQPGSVDAPLAEDDPSGTTTRQNFTCWWAQWRDGIIHRDMDWIRSIHPEVMTLEKWMRAQNYTGRKVLKILKDWENGRELAFAPNPNVVSKL